jgi:hypothetical protein
MLCFHQCMLGNINTPASLVKHAFCGMTGWGFWGSATAPEGWKDLSPPHQAFKSQPCHGGQFTSLSTTAQGFFESSKSRQPESPTTVYLNRRIIFVSYVFVQTFSFTKEHLPLSCWTHDSSSIVNLTGPDTSHSFQPRNGCFVPRFGEPNTY